ncbi:MAG TPA: hypothetical protein ENJ64_02720 [Thiotrichales bacterium]|nr:hypothetical protein [Thiotrichales bacterium]
MSSSHNTDAIEAGIASLKKEALPSIPTSGQQWLQQALDAIITSDDATESLGLYSAMAKRKLGDALLQQASPVDTNFSPLDIRHWHVADAGRLILLMSAILNAPQQTENLITAYYRMGDEAEHIALIHGLIFFAPADYLTTIALDAGRTNSLELLAALTLDNPYPASFYNEAAFNQMVLKGLFLGLAIERVVGIEQRANAELTRMCENYVVERENAGRSVPADIWLAIGPFATDTGREQMLRYLKHEDIGHRYYSALALSQRLSQDPSLNAILEQHLQNEQAPLIRKLLQETLQT